MLDLLTDVLFCVSLYYEAAGSPLFFASAGCIGVSVVFNFSATLWLYYSRGKKRGSEIYQEQLARSVFDVAQPSHHKARRRRRRRRRARRRRPSKG